MSKEIEEYQARGEIARVYHEVKQVLRITGVNLVFRVWAHYGELLPVLWDALRPNLETLAFEEAAGALRSEAVREAADLGSLEGLARVPLGQSQAWQIRAALDLYHYANPKLLVLVSAVRLSLEGERVGRGDTAEQPLIELGVPDGMYPMDMIAEDTNRPTVARIFKDMRKTLGIERVNSDYRTLALWPHYLAEAWERLKPIIAQGEYVLAREGLRRRSVELARNLPFVVPLSGQRIEAAGQNPKHALERVTQFERLLPGLILNMSLIALTWQSADALVFSPFPVNTRAPRVLTSGGRP